MEEGAGVKGEGGKGRGRGDGRGVILRDLDTYVLLRGTYLAMVCNL